MALTTIFQQNSSSFWKGADIINQQKALLAVQDLQKKYCTKETPSIFSSGEATASSSKPRKQPRKPAETTSTPLTLSKTPHQIEAQNPPCEILCLPGTTENNIKASKLFIESEFNLYMTKVSF